MTHPFQGLTAATFTPLHPDGSLNLEIIPRLIDHLVDSGVKGIFVNGTTGEGVSLTTDERYQTASAYLKAAEGRLTRIVHVGHESLSEAQSLARHAASLGADALSAIPPYYFKPGTIPQLIACLETLTTVVPDTPFYYYHIPSLTGVSVDLQELLRQAEQRLPSLVGIKYSDTDLSVFLACSTFKSSKYTMMFGSDENLLGALAVGARSAVGSTYNFAAPLYLRLIAAFEEGDLETAREAQGQSVQLIRAIMSTCHRGGLKAVMRFIGIDCGPNRLPIREPDHGQIEELRNRLEAIGFFDWSRRKGV